MADYQDFKPVVLRKTNAGRSKPTAADRRAGNTETKAKYDTSGTIKNGALDDASEAQRVTAIPTEFKKALMQARQAKKMTQKQLASQIGEKAQVVQDYENGKAIPNPQIITKLNRALGVRLPKIQKPKKRSDE